MIGQPTRCITVKYIECACADHSVQLISLRLKTSITGYVITLISKVYSISKFYHIVNINAWYSNFFHLGPLAPSIDTIANVTGRSCAMLRLTYICQTKAEW